MTLDVQFMTMISMILGGFYLGLALETFRRFSFAWKNNTFLLYFMEICFWLTQSFILFYLLFRVHGGDIRLCVFIASFFGFAADKALASKVHVRILERLITIGTSIYRFSIKLFHRIILAPIKFIIHFVIALLKRVVKEIIAILTFLVTIICGPRLWLLKKVYHL